MPGEDASLAIAASSCCVHALCASVEELIPRFAIVCLQMAGGHTPSPVYRRFSGFRRHSNQKHSSKEAKACNRKS
jgi:hypothetical protein